MTLPNFLVIGFTRCGTTTLYQCLNEHPNIYLPDKKELWFFNQDKEFEKGLSYYEGFFEKGQSKKAVGEVSPPYIQKGQLRDIYGNIYYDPENDSRVRIKNTLSDVKFVVCLRNPIDRLLSQYNKNLYQGKTREKLFLGIEKELKKGRSYSKGKPLWVFRNLFGLHLQPWLESFRYENFYFMVLEEWKDNFNKELPKLHEFLGVEAKEFDYSGINKNSSASKKNRSRKSKLFSFIKNQPIKNRNFTSEDRGKLKTIFEQDVAQLKELTGMNLTIWEDFK